MSARLQTSNRGTQKTRYIFKKNLIVYNPTLTKDTLVKRQNYIQVFVSFMKRPLIREDLKVIQYQSQEADNTFITSDGTSPYNSTRKWAVKRHYREDNN